MIDKGGRNSRFHAPLDGVVAQLVERLNGIQEVRGSNPLGSTILSSRVMSYTYLIESIRHPHHR